MRITLSGRIPSKKNSRVNTRSGRSYPSKAYQQWHKQSFAQLLSQGIKKESYDSLKRITLYFTFGDKRVTDLTNKTESVMDLLVDYGYLKDDNWMCTGQLILDPQYEKGVFSVDIEIELK